MCIQEVKAWAFAGKHYDTEQAAVWAAIDEIARRTVKDHSNNPGRGLIESDDLPELLIRYRTLTTTREGEAPAESLEGTYSEKPEGTYSRSDMSFDERAQGAM
jgi:hypothetical protein